MPKYLLDLTAVRIKNVNTEEIFMIETYIRNAAGGIWIISHREKGFFTLDRNQADYYEFID